MLTELGLVKEDTVDLTIYDTQRLPQGGLTIVTFEVLTFVETISVWTWGWIVELLHAQNFVNRYPVSVSRDGQLHNFILAQQDREIKKLTISWIDP